MGHRISRVLRRLPRTLVCSIQSNEKDSIVSEEVGHISRPREDCALQVVSYGMAKDKPGVCALLRAES
eukprot:scaffold308102_cov30-Tisochrysis_lutea.AAC.6